MKNVLLNIKFKSLHYMNSHALTNSRCEFNDRGEKSANAFLLMCKLIREA
jgi:hypothetical protein